LLDLREYRTGTDKRPDALAVFARPVKLFDLQTSAREGTSAELHRLRDQFNTTSTRDRIVRQIRRRISKTFLWPATHFREKQYRFDPRVKELGADVYLQGYWQSWKYFEDIEQVIRNEFQPKDAGVLPYVRDYIGKLKSLGGPVVALHSRRGDLAAAHEMNKGNLVHAQVMGLDYHHAAMKKMPADARFLVFSDTPKDIEWCKQHMRPDWLPADRMHFSDGHTDIQDMFLMAACDHNITANSTFSWWSAWLNSNPDKRVITPKIWSSAMPGATSQMVTDDLIPPSWEMI